jgi:membrane protein DedA with SNARE-associated domain
MNPGDAMIMLGIMSGLLANSSAIIQGFVTHYGYLAIFALMVLESTSLPVPSEVILPLSGLLAAEGFLNFYLALAAGVLGALVGIALAYAIGYYVGKDIIYKHLRLFHIKQESLDSFDEWFDRNGIAAVFISRLVPEVRALMSYPAGFAKMPLKGFFAYSIAGTLIWNTVLMLFGFYLLSAHSAVIVMGSVGVFAILLYAVYALSMKRMKR